MATKTVFKKKEFTKAKFIKLYGELTQQELADMLGVKQPAIAYWAKKFGLKKTRAKKVKWS